MFVDVMVVGYGGWEANSHGIFCWLVYILFWKGATSSKIDSSTNSVTWIDDIREKINMNLFEKYSDQLHIIFGDEQRF